MPDERFDRLERKIDVLTTAVASRFDRIDARFDRVDARFDRLEKYLKSIETTQKHINRELSDDVADHERRLVVVEKKVSIEPIE